MCGSYVTIINAGCKDSITSADNINLRYGNLEMSGGNSQVIPSGSFKNNAVNNFMVNNNSATVIYSEAL